MIIEGSRAVDAKLIECIRRLVIEDPATHSYLMYDLIYEPRNSEAVLIVESDEIVGYALLWRGRGACALHLWGSLPEEVVRDFVDRASRVSASVKYVHVHSPWLEDLATQLARELLGSCSVEKFIDMIVDRRSFKPLNRSVDAELRELDPDRDAEALAKLWASRGTRASVSVDEVRRVLENVLYVGAFIDNKLVSTAAAIVRLRDAWIVADVYTDPRYRGRGLGTAVTSYITSRGLEAGVKKIALHVHESNEVAKRIYLKLGYREVAKKTWIVCKPYAEH